MEQQTRNENSGIKLLNSSENFLTTLEACTEHEKVSKKRKKHRKISKDPADDVDAMSKFREAAIDPERILSKSDTRAWTSKRPEPDFKYKKLKDGTLVEQK